MRKVFWKNNAFWLSDTAISSPPLYVKEDVFDPVSDKLFYLRNKPEICLMIDEDDGMNPVRFHMENHSSQTVDLDIFPPFAEMCVDDPYHYDTETLFISSCRHDDTPGYWAAHACIGGIGNVTAHIPQDIFDNSMFYTMPTGAGYLNVLSKIGGSMTLQPNEKREMVCWMYTGEGDRNDALDDLFRQKVCFAYDRSRYDDSLYRRISWVPDITCALMNWAWDRDVMNPQTGEYTLADSLKKWTETIGKIDLYVLWPFWPRAGFDERDQFDHYCCFPGGLDGLREEIKKVQSLGIRVILAYCFWSEADRAGTEIEERELLDKSFRTLLDIGERLDCDGFDMDCMNEIPEALWELSRKNHKDYLPYNEGDPGYEKSQTNLLGRLHDSSMMTVFNLKRYMLPHHPILRVTGPGLFGKRMRNEIVLSFFNGHGIEWNLVFGTNDVNCRDDWEIWKKVHPILQAHRSCFLSDQWQPFIRSLNSRVWINRWPGEENCLYTICSTIPEGFSGDILSLPKDDAVHYVDLFSLREIPVCQRGEHVFLPLRLEGYETGKGVEIGTGDYTAGCIAAYPKCLTVSNFMEKLFVSVVGYQQGDRIELLCGHNWNGEKKVFYPVTDENCSSLEVDLFREFGFTNDAIVVMLKDQKEQIRDIAILPEATVRLFAISSMSKAVLTEKQAGKMVLIPEGEYDYVVQQSQPIWFNTYVNLSPTNDSLYHTAPPSVPRRIHIPAFYMDPYPVTNREYMNFVKATGYSGGKTIREREGFLRHLPGLMLTDELADKPVVNVSYQDACAYCRWAGKRLPTEQEWQYAAGGADSRLYPWGDSKDSSYYNDTGKLTDVNAYPLGVSPYGIYDMVGNVYQWTDPVVTNGSHEMVYLRGGSFYTAPNGKDARWWVKGGLNNIRDHHPLPLFGPQMNRLSTVGFRCVADIR